MLKGEEPQEVFIAPMTSVQVYIDEDDVIMLRVCKIENGRQTCSEPQVVSMGPATEVVCEKLPWMYRFAVAYLKSDGVAYARQAKYEGDNMWWSEEVEENSCCLMEGWSHMN